MNVKSILSTFRSIADRMSDCSFLKVAVFIVLWGLAACDSDDFADEKPETDSAVSFYPISSMIVVTTNYIRDNSNSLDDFVDEKNRRHIEVLVATEDDFGGSELKGVQKAVQIRRWLQTLYEDYQYVLLIGDPHPEYGDIPFLNAQVSIDNPCESIGFSCSSVPTDSFYSDLDGNWDMDDDGVFGEWVDDYRGINFEAELIVGRIPVYFENVDDLDRILDTAIEYMNAKTDQIDYRRKALIPATIPFYQDEFYLGSPSADGAKVIEYLEKIFFNSEHRTGKDFTLDALVEKAGIAPSAYNAPPLTRESLIETWSKGYGFVFWIAHGYLTGSVRTVWVEDSNQSGRPDKKTEYDSPWMIKQEDFLAIKTEPGFVFMGSCINASPRSPDNIAYAALLHGIAVGVGANTQPASANDLLVDAFEPDDVHPYIYTYGTYFTLGLAMGEAPAMVIVRKKALLGNEPQSEEHERLIFRNKLMLNYFGDPTLTLNSSIEDVF